MDICRRNQRTIKTKLVELEMYTNFNMHNAHENSWNGSQTIFHWQLNQSVSEFHVLEINSAESNSSLSL